MTSKQVFAEHLAVMQKAAGVLPDALEYVARMLQACLARGGKVLACGNGGSAATSQHLVAELVCRFRHDRPALAAISLTADTMTLTAIANDYGYARVFARQVEAICAPGDALVAFSTSGNSANVVEAAKVAHALGCTVIAFTGNDGGELASHADIVVRAPTLVVARVQEVHDLCIHAIAQAIEDGVCAKGTQ